MILECLGSAVSYISKKAAVNDSLDGVGLHDVLPSRACSDGRRLHRCWLALCTRPFNSSTGRFQVAQVSRFQLHRSLRLSGPACRGESRERSRVLSAPLSVTLPQAHTVQGPTSVAVDDLQPPWNEDKIFRVIQARYELDVQIDLMRLLAHAEESGSRIYYGSGAQPALAGWYTSAGTEFSAWNLYLPASAEDQSARVLVKLAGMKKKLGMPLWRKPSAERSSGTASPAARTLETRCASTTSPQPMSPT